MADPIQLVLIDDDYAVLDSLRLYFERPDFKTDCFASAEAFFTALDGGLRPDCIVSDVRMTGISGLELVRRLADRRLIMPIILMTGVGDIDMAVSAIKNGAFDFIEKPFDEGRLLAAIQKAVAMGRQHAFDATEVEKLRSRFKTLSERQRQVMELAVAGSSNKQIGLQLNISPKTVENHRAWVMERMGAKNLAELVRIAMKIEGLS